MAIIQNQFWRNFTAISILLLAVLFCLIFILDAVLVFAISVLISLIFHPFVCFFERRGLTRKSSTFMVFLITIVTLYVAFYTLIPMFAEQMEQLLKTLKDFSIHQQLVSADKEIRKYFPFIARGELTKRAEAFLSSAIIGGITGLSDILSSVVSIVALLVIVPFITYFLLKDNRLIMKNILASLPNQYFEPGYWVVRKVSIQLGKFVRAWLFDATFVGVSCGIGFYLIGIPNSLPLGFIAGFGHLIPYFGPVIGGVPAIIISFITLGNFSQLPLIIVLLMVIYIIDNGIVQPYVFSKSLDIHPIFIILLIVAGSQIGGVVGMLLAVPLATVVKTMVKEIYFAFKYYSIS